ncbi:MAG: hypothetical protein JXB23_09985 [Candidatus Aminicenantes bacterium]|nr:hypothetical protein [Candidatus Aminicenantes bacterium]
MKKTGIVFLIIIMLSPLLSADTLSLSFVHNATDNLFQSSLAEADQVSGLTFSLDKDISGFSLFTSGTYSHIYENSQITYYNQDLGLDYLFSLGDTTALYFSVLGSGTFYRSEYSDFNYTAFSVFSVLKSYLSQTSILKGNYSFVYRNYKASLFDYWSHALLVSLDKYFETKTTIKAEVNWGYKYFIHPNQEQVYSFEEGMPQFSRGKGKGKQTGPGMLPPADSIRTGGEGIQIFSVSSLLAQGLGSKIGLNFNIMRQWVLSGKNPFATVQEFYMVENPSYDRFSWAGYEMGSQFTLLIPWMVELKTGYSYSEKRFPGIESLNLDEEPLGIMRKDRRGQVDVILKKNFARISVFLSYAYIVNRSNDPYFDWSGHFFSVGFNWSHSLGGGQ